MAKRSREIRDEAGFDSVQAGLDHIDQGITIFDSELNLVAWNRMFFQMLDFPEELARRGTPFSAFMRHNAERGEYGEGDVETLVAQRVETARRFLPHTMERVRPNGRVIAVRGEPLPDGGGFVTVYSDVTEQREEERRILAEKAGLESRLRLITDSVPALIAYIDCEERYQFVNRGYADWVGRRKEGVLGRKVRTILGPAVYETIKPYIDAAFHGERATYEYSDVRGGRTVHARSTLVPEVLDDGSIAGLFVLSSDITVEKAAQAALVQAQKMQAIGQLTGGLAHDFNNLLTIVIGNLATLAERPDTAEFVEPALAAARRGADLTRRLLAFARRQPLAPQPTEINGLIASMVGLLDRSLSRNVEIALTHRAGTAYALVDPQQMENALINLALNARDAMPDGGRLSIATSLVDAAGLVGFDDTVPAGDYIRVDVTDTGTGMDAETLSRAFEPFFTRKQPGSGSGLGLPMVYGFVKQSGGHIRLTSKPGEGTTVTLLLPCAPEPAETSAGVPEPPAASAARAAPAAQRLVLVVEDEPDVRTLLRRQLTEAGHAVLVAASGAEALELLETVEDLDVLVTDVVMPGRPDGLSLAAIARRRRPDLRIVVVTGHAERLATPGRAAPLPYPVLTKPFSAAELVAAVVADGPVRR